MLDTVLTWLEANAWWIGLIAAGLTIGGFLIKGYRYIINLRRTADQQQKQREEELKKKVASLSAVGTNLTARADLAQLIRLELGFLENELNELRHRTSLFTIAVAVLMLLPTVILTQLVVSLHDKVFGIGFTVGAFAAMPLMYLMLKECSRLNKYLESYYLQAQDIWRHPISKRMGPEEKLLIDDKSDSK